MRGTPHVEDFADPLYLAVTHSEYSAKSARQMWSERLGVPVLDEYSSEEATRIALEMPCGHYHVCEDTVHLDVLDPETLQPQTPGQSGCSCPGWCCVVAWARKASPGR